MNNRRFHFWLTEKTGENIQGHLDPARIETLAAELASLQARDKRLVLVTSGKLRTGDQRRPAAQRGRVGRLGDPFPAAGSGPRRAAP